MTTPVATTLPDGTRLVHIGPHKTGTTALQSAFHTRRADIAAQGVHYAGSERQPGQAVKAITGRASAYTDGKAPPLGRWQALVREVRAVREGRVVISSEGFADAAPAAIQTIVRDLDPERIHVVVTLRPLASILPSQWQQYVQGGLMTAYEDWLDSVLSRPDEGPGRGFWHRHRHDKLVARWADAVGPERVTVIVADDRDHGWTLRALEGLVGLRSGTLVPEPDLTNRSLTLAEVETVRAFNVAFRAEGLAMQLHAKLMRVGAGVHMKRRVPGAAEARVRTPRWALERATEVSHEIVAGIAESGVRVLGDLESLAVAPDAGRTGEAPPGGATEEAWPSVAASAAMGVVIASGFLRTPSTRAQTQEAWPDGSGGAALRPPRVGVEPFELARVSTQMLGFVLLRRLGWAVMGRLPRIKRRG